MTNTTQYLGGQFRIASHNKGTLFCVEWSDGEMHQKHSNYYKSEKMALKALNKTLKEHGL